MNRTIAITFTLLFVLTGCAGAPTVPAIEQPTVELRGVEMGKLRLSGQTVMLKFDVANPNPFPLPIESIRYHVMIDDASFASGETPSSFSVPAGGASSFDISVELDVLRSSNNIATLLKSGMRKPVEYELNGTLAVDIPLVKPLQFKNVGVISIASN